VRSCVDERLSANIRESLVRRTLKTWQKEPAPTSPRLVKTEFAHAAIAVDDEFEDSEFLVGSLELELVCG